MKYLFFWSVFVLGGALNGQIEHKVLLRVQDEHGFVLSHVLVEWGEGEHMETDERGELVIGITCPEQVVLRFSKPGFVTQEMVLKCPFPVELLVRMERVVSLQEVVVTCDQQEQLNRGTSLHVERYDTEVLREFGRSSVVQTLSRMAGVWSFDRGMGQSKPIVRGFGFDRVVVIEDGFKQEGPHWMAEHALHLDEHAIERAEIVRGPAAFLYGAEALGGAIIIDYYPDLVGKERTVTEISAGAMSGTMGLNIAGKYIKRINNFTAGAFISGRIDGDYATLADSVDIYSYRVPLTGRLMRNTASNNINTYVFIGYRDSLSEYRGVFRVLQSKTGFFANAHGLEPQMIEYHQYDRNRYDVMMPYHLHKGVAAQIKGKNLLSERMLLQWQAGYQHYELSEFSRYVPHGYMPPVFPDTLSIDPMLEYFFGVQAFSGQLAVTGQNSFFSTLKSGIVTSYKKTLIDGRSFLLPSHHKTAGGVFIVAGRRHRQFLFEAGARFDVQQISVEPYRDWFQSAVVIGTDSVWQFIERAAKQKRWYDALGWGMGFVYPAYGDHYWKVHAGKGYRFPDVREFSANGVNYHWLRFEKGNADLQTEKLYELNVLRSVHYRKWAGQFSGYISFSPSFIYLQPTPAFDVHYGQGLQIYQYTQTQVFRTGCEFHQHYHLAKHHLIGFVGEYVYTEQLTGPHRGFPLPFTPPGTLLLHYKFHSWYSRFFEQSWLFFDLVYMMPQRRVVPPEEQTSSTFLVHAGIGIKKSFLSGSSMKLNMQIENVLNQKYQLHMSYYRLLNLPEPGRSIRLNVTWNISQKNKRRDVL